MVVSAGNIVLNGLVLYLHSGRYHGGMISASLAD